jgi:hypothetical protein
MIFATTGIHFREITPGYYRVRVEDLELNCSIRGCVIFVGLGKFRDSECFEPISQLSFPEVIRTITKATEEMQKQIEALWD